MLADDKKIELQNVEGVLVYRDAFETNTYYYSSTRPVVARHAGEYQFTQVVYQPVPNTGPVGMLSFVVDLEPPDDRLNEMSEQLRKLSPGAELKPIPWTSGTVAVAIRGGDPVFGTPSLMGRNSAVVSVPLTTNQFLILKNSLAGEPVSVVYKLSYEAFRRAYEFSIEFNESKFREWVQTKCELNFLFFSFESESTFQELQTNSVIKVTSVNQTGESPPEGFRRAFLQSLQSLLTPLPRFAEPPEGGEGSWLIGFGCNTVKDIQNISRRLDCDMRISGAVARSAYIQGALGGFADAYKRRGFVTLPTADLFIQKLTVRCDRSFDGNPLKAVTVVIDHNPSLTHTFSNDNRQEWAIELVHHPRKPHKYQYRCNLHLGSDLGGDKLATGSFEIKRDQAFLDIVPEAFFTYRSYSVSAEKDFPWELLTQVQLEPALHKALTFQPDSLQLTGSKPCGQIAAFARQRVSLDDVEFKATCKIRSSSATFHLERLLPSGKTIFLNPFRQQSFTFQASKDFNWARYTEIRVRVNLPANSLLKNGELSFVLKPAEGAKKLTFWRADNGRKLSYETAFRARSGESPRVPGLEATERVVEITAPE